MRHLVVAATDVPALVAAGVGDHEEVDPVQRRELRARSRPYQPPMDSFRQLPEVVRAPREPLVEPLAIVCWSICLAR